MNEGTRRFCRPRTAIHWTPSILLSIAVAAALLGLLAQPATAATPPMIHYQAYLTDDGGTPVNGTVDLEFAIFDSSATGTELWMETHSGIQVQEGVFSVALGSLANLDTGIFDSGNRWLETRLNGVPVTPRRPFLSVPYALRAQVAETALTGGGDGAWVVDGSNVYRPDGNVGVGTNSPTERFHAVSPLFARLRLERTGGSIVQLDASGSTGAVGTQSLHPFRLLTNNTVRVHVDTDGEVGVGSTTPDGKLDVRASGGQDVLNLYDNASLVMSVVSGGKVGIGVGASTPQDRLQVVTGSETVGVSGRASAATGFTFGGVFTSDSGSGTGAQGTGGTFGLHGVGTSASGIGVFAQGPSKGIDGVSTATTGTTYGGYFQNSTAGGAGVYGSSGSGTGVKGYTNSSGFGVHGVNASTDGSATGVKGEGGVYGVAAEGGSVGVNGIGIGPTGSIGIFGQSNASTAGTGILGHEREHDN